MKIIRVECCNECPRIDWNASECGETGAYLSEEWLERNEIHPDCPLPDDEVKNDPT